MAFESKIEDWNLLTQFCQAYRTLSEHLIDQIAMHRAQATLVCQLFERDGCTQSEIANQLGVQGSTVTNMLQRMEEAGLVTRERDPDDNRLVRVYLTEEGRKKERLINEQFLKVEAAIFAGFNPEDRATLRGLLRRMLRNMDPG